MVAPYLFVSSMNLLRTSSESIALSHSTGDIQTRQNILDAIETSCMNGDILLCNLKFLYGCSMWQTYFTKVA
jgi:hypothetical protein